SVEKSAFDTREQSRPASSWVKTSGLLGSSRGQRREDTRRSGSIQSSADPLDRQRERRLPRRPACQDATPAPTTHCSEAYSHGTDQPLPTWLWCRKRPRGGPQAAVTRL